MNETPKFITLVRTVNDEEFVTEANSFVDKPISLEKFLELYFRFRYHHYDNINDLFRDDRYYRRWYKMDDTFQRLFLSKPPENILKCIQIVHDYGFEVPSKFEEIFKISKGKKLEWSKNSKVVAEIKRWANFKRWDSNEALEIIGYGIPRGRDFEIFDHHYADPDVGQHMERDVLGGVLPIAENSDVDFPMFYPKDVIAWAKEHKYILDSSLPLVVHYYEEGLISKQQENDFRKVGRPNASKIWIKEYNGRLDAGNREKTWEKEIKYLTKFYEDYKGEKPARQPDIQDNTIKKSLTKKLFNDNSPLPDDDR